MGEDGTKLCRVEDVVGLVDEDPRQSVQGGHRGQHLSEVSRLEGVRGAGEAVQVQEVTHGDFWAVGEGGQADRGCPVSDLAAQERVRGHHQVEAGDAPLAVDVHGQEEREALPGPRGSDEEEVGPPLQDVLDGQGLLGRPELGEGIAGERAKGHQAVRPGRRPVELWDRGSGSVLVLPGKEGAGERSGGLGDALSGDGVDGGDQAREEEVHEVSRLERGRGIPGNQILGALQRDGGFWRRRSRREIPGHQPPPPVDHHGDGDVTGDVVHAKVRETVGDHAVVAVCHVSRVARLEVREEVPHGGPVLDEVGTQPVAVQDGGFEVTEGTQGEPGAYPPLVDRFGGGSRDGVGEVLGVQGVPQAAEEVAVCHLGGPWTEEEVGEEGCEGPDQSQVRDQRLG